MGGLLLLYWPHNMMTNIDKPEEQRRKLQKRFKLTYFRESKYAGSTTIKHPQFQTIC